MWNTFKRQSPVRHTMVQQLDFEAFKLDERAICRPVQFADLSQIVVLQRHCYASYVAWDYIYLLEDFENNPFAIYWQIEVDGQMVAVLIGRLLMRDAHLSHLMVLPMHQGKGYGRHLLYMWQQAVLELAIPQATLEVGASNTIAQTLYRQAGYEVVSKIPGYYKQTNETALVMRVKMKGSEVT